MWILRGIAFVASKAESILLPESLTRFAKSPLGLGAALYPVPMLCMLVVSVLGAVYLQRTVMGRHVFALGGNAEASRFSGLRLGRIQIGVYVLAGLDRRPRRLPRIGLLRLGLLWRRDRI